MTKIYIPQNLSIDLSLWAPEANLTTPPVVVVRESWTFPAASVTPDDIHVVVKIELRDGADFDTGKITKDAETLIAGILDAVHNARHTADKCKQDK